MKTEFNGKIYDHPMIAERQREVAVSIKALRMMQEHHGNRYFSFKCVSHDEEAEWYRKAEAIVPPTRAQNAALTADGGKPCDTARVAKPPKTLEDAISYNPAFHTLCWDVATPDGLVSVSSEGRARDLAEKSWPALSLSSHQLGTENG